MVVNFVLPQSTIFINILMHIFTFQTALFCIDQLAKLTFRSRYAHTPFGTEWRTDGHRRIYIFCLQYEEALPAT